MTQHKAPKKTIRADSPEVREFAAYLDSLIKERTSENKLIQTAKVGKSKLSAYLDGTDVPHRRVLESYILGPLETYATLGENEHATLMGLYEQACRVQPPKPPTLADQVKFLEEDLVREGARLAEVTELLDKARDRERVDSEQIERLRTNRERLHGQLAMLASQVGELLSELEKLENSRQECEAKLIDFAERVRRELDECQHRISSMEMALGNYMMTSVELQKDVHYLKEEVHCLRQENIALRIKLADPVQEEAAEQRRLFMKLVNHVANGEALARLSDRLERGEETIARLTETNGTLTKTIEALTTELDLANQELHFLRAAVQDEPEPEDRLVPMYMSLYAPEDEVVPQTREYRIPSVDELLAKIQGDRLRHRPGGGRRA